MLSPQGDLNLDDDANFGQEYKKLTQAMEMVGFLASTKKQYVWFGMLVDQCKMIVLSILCVCACACTCTKRFLPLLRWQLKKLHT